MNRIGLVVAMEAESKEMYGTLGRVVREESISGYKVTEFEYNDKVLFMIWSGIGEISAAMATQILILTKGVELVINFGLVGGLVKDLKCRDIVLVKEVVHYDYSLNYSDISARGKYWFDREKSALPIELFGLEKAVEELGLRQVRIASGDKFIDDSVKKDWLVKNFGCEVCDMESAGINLACRFNKIPLIMLKAVSDNADENAQESIMSIVNSGIDYYINAVHELLRSKYLSGDSGRSTK